MSATQEMITGSMVALVTPMYPDGSIDWDALDRLVDWHVAEGTDAIVAVGTTGESATLDHAEHVAVVRRVVGRAAGRIAVIAGSGSNSTLEAIDLTGGAREAGAQAALLVTPYYNKPTQEGLYQHYRTIAEAVDIPLILYNVPGRTACDMHNETVARLAEIDNIVGIKDATGDLERGSDLLDLVGDRLAVYSGDDGTAAEYMLMGAKGNISVTANVVPAAMHRLCAAALAGNADATRSEDALLADLHRVLFVEANPIPVKWALAEMGRIQSGIRLPLTPLSEPMQQKLHTALDAAGLLPE